MQKPVLLSMLSLFTAGILGTSAHVAYADCVIHTGTGHISQFFNKQQKQYHPHDKNEYMPPIKANTKKTANIDAKQAMTNLNQIVTQFEQAIDKYQQKAPPSSVQSRETTGEKSTENLPNTPPKARRSTDKIAPKANNTSGFARTNNTNDTIHIPTGVAPIHKEKNTTPAVSGTPKKAPAKKVATAPKSTGVTAPAKSTTPRWQTQLQNALTAYHTATNRDKAAQNQLSSVVQTYITNFSDLTATTDDTTLSAPEADVAQALTQLKNALGLQNQVEEQIAHLQQAAKQRQTSTMKTTLVQMAKNEQQKASDIAQAAATIQSVIQAMQNQASAQ